MQSGRIFGWWAGVLAVACALLVTPAWAAGGPIRTLQWTARAPMPNLLLERAATVGRDGLLYVAGGGQFVNVGGPFRGSDYFARYDPRTDTWTPLAPMPTPRYGLALAAGQDGLIYAIGGSNAARDGLPFYLPTVEAYDPRTNTWRTSTSLSIGRVALGAATGPNGDIYVVGGVSSSDYAAAMEIYDPHRGTWLPGPPMPTPRSRLGVTFAKGQLYTVGGEVSGGFSTTAVEVFDPQSEHWTARASFPAPIGSLGLAATPDGTVFAVGGGGTNYPWAVVAYDAAQDQWTVQSPLPQASGATVAGIAGGELIAVSSRGADVNAAAVRGHGT